jgi:hypothetical protein
MKSLQKQIKAQQDNLDFLKKDHVCREVELNDKIDRLKMKYDKEVIANVLKSLDLKEGDKVTNGNVVGKIVTIGIVENQVYITIMVGDYVGIWGNEVKHISSKYFVPVGQVVTSSKDTRWRKCWMDRMDLKKEEVMKEEILC